MCWQWPSKEHKQEALLYRFSLMSPTTYAGNDGRGEREREGPSFLPGQSAELSSAGRMSPGVRSEAKAAELCDAFALL